MSRNLLLVAALALLLACAVDAKKPDGKPSKKPSKKPPACVAGEGGCDLCTKNGKKCEVCSPGTLPDGSPALTGMYVTGKGACQACPDLGCAKCRKGSGTCVACVPGSALGKRKACVPCGDGFVVTKGRCKVQKAPKQPETETETETEHSTENESGDT